MFPIPTDKPGIATDSGSLTDFDLKAGVFAGGPPPESIQLKESSDFQETLQRVRNSVSSSAEQAGFPGLHETAIITSTESTTIPTDVIEVAGAAFPSDNSIAGIGTAAQLSKAVTPMAAAKPLVIDREIQLNNDSAAGFEPLHTTRIEDSGEQSALADEVLQFTLLLNESNELLDTPIHDGLHDPAINDAVSSEQTQTTIKSVIPQDNRASAKPIEPAFRTTSLSPGLNTVVGRSEYSQFPQQPIVSVNGGGQAEIPVNRVAPQLVDSFSSDSIQTDEREFPTRKTESRPVYSGRLTTDSVSNLTAIDTSVEQRPRIQNRESQNVTRVNSGILSGNTANSEMVRSENLAEHLSRSKSAELGDIAKVYGDPNAATQHDAKENATFKSIVGQGHSPALDAVVPANRTIGQPAKNDRLNHSKPNRTEIEVVPPGVESPAIVHDCASSAGRRTAFQPDSLFNKSRETFVSTPFETSFEIANLTVEPMELPAGPDHQGLVPELNRFQSARTSLVDAMNGTKTFDVGDITEQLMQGIRKHRAIQQTAARQMPLENRSIVRIELDPPELGSVTVEIKRTEEITRVHIVAEHTLAHSLLEKNIDVLLGSFRESDSHSFEVDVSHRDSGHPKDEWHGDVETTQPSEPRINGDVSETIAANDASTPTEINMIV